VPEELGDAELLDRVVLDDEQPLAARRRVLADARERGLDLVVVVDLVTKE
jgi:hypothetical protein